MKNNSNGILSVTWRLSSPSLFHLCWFANILEKGGKTVGGSKAISDRKQKEGTEEQYGEEKARETEIGCLSRWLNGDKAAYRCP
ncbi:MULTISPECIES: hypothetical protein [unclassified Peribacillus]|uniref:hypothetical protein n=1 Tax=unclassified Peribacillus TaxID=2675266 RepID=UPI001E3BBA57|nr:hypothetical protein [Peribacillus sp. Bi96]